MHDYVPYIYIYIHSHGYDTPDFYQWVQTNDFTLSSLARFLYAYAIRA